MKNAKVLMLVAIVAGMLFVVAGCQKVTVMDQDGKGIAFAKVQITSHGGEGASMPIMTDMFGNVMLTTNLAEPDAREWLIVSKTGYNTRRVNRDRESDMIVTLYSSTKRSKALKTKKAPKPKVVDKNK